MRSTTAHDHKPSCDWVDHSRPDGPIPGESRDPLPGKASRRREGVAGDPCAAPASSTLRASWTSVTRSALIFGQSDHPQPVEPPISSSTNTASIIKITQLTVKSSQTAALNVVSCHHVRRSLVLIWNTYAFQRLRTATLLGPNRESDCRVVDFGCSKQETSSPK